MKNFDYHISTDIYFGKGQISKLGDNISSIGKKILLVYGGGSIKKSGLYDQVISQLDRAGVKVYELSGVEPNPRIESVRKGVKICLENKIDAVLAVGGGSSIDCAKVIASGACYSGDPWDLVLDANKITKALLCGSFNPGGYRFRNGRFCCHIRYGKERKMGDRQRHNKTCILDNGSGVYFQRIQISDCLRLFRYNEPHLRKLFQFY